MRSPLSGLSHETDRMPAAVLTSEIRSLTGLRGCAAVMVMLYHYSLGLPSDTLPFQTLLRNSYLFVDLFFVLSGFVMGYSQRAPFEAGYRFRRHRSFLAARFARIYPLYALVTLESFCLLTWRGSETDPFTLGQTLVLNLSLVQAWGLAPSLEGATWSISTEWAAYLLFPLLLGLTVYGPRRRAVSTAALAFAAIAGLAFWSGPVGFPGQGRMGPLDIYSSATVLPLVRCVAEFALGLVTFRVARHWAAGMDDVAARWAWIVAGLIVAALSHSGLDLGVVALFPVLVLVLVPCRHGIGRLLGTTIPYRLGQWSYSIYLLHDKFSHSVGFLRAWLAVRIPFASAVTVLLVGSVVVALSAATFAAVELPLRRLLQRVIGQKRSAPIEAAPIAMARS